MVAGGGGWRRVAAGGGSQAVQGVVLAVVGDHTSCSWVGAGVFWEKGGCWCSKLPAWRRPQDGRRRRLPPLASAGRSRALTRRWPGYALYALPSLGRQSLRRKPPQDRECAPLNCGRPLPLLYLSFPTHSELRKKKPTKRFFRTETLAKSIRIIIYLLIYSMIINELI